MCDNYVLNLIGSIFIWFHHLKTDIQVKEMSYQFSEFNIVSSSNVLDILSDVDYDYGYLDFQYSLANKNLETQKQIIKIDNYTRKLQHFQRKIDDLN